MSSLEIKEGTGRNPFQYQGFQRSVGGGGGGVVGGGVHQCLWFVCLA